MSNIEKLKSEITPQLSQELSELMLNSNKTLLSRLEELDKRLTNTNFLTNGGGAVAVVALMGEHAVPLAVKVALVLFTIGVVATGIELRALMIHLYEVSADNTRRHNLFQENQITVLQLGQVSPNVGRSAKFVNHWAGLLSQLVFISGVIAAAVGFLA